METEQPKGTIRNTGPSHADHRERADRGAALTLSLLFSIIAMGIVFSGTLILQSTQRKTDTTFRVNSQATQFARSGITDALSWFRRQTSQPVLAFEPQLDATAIPATLDTDDPDVGIMREFRISDNIWGRYEVWKQWEADPDPDRLAWRRQNEVRDVSLARGQASPGNSWRIRSVGEIYLRYDDSVPLQQRPNRRVAIRTLETDILRMRLAPPGKAAVCIRTGTNAVIGDNGRVRGGELGSGLYFTQGTGPASIASGGEASGVTPTADSPDYDDSPEAVFGLSAAEVMSIADDLIGTPADFPSPIPGNAVVVADVPGQTITFDSTRPLAGTGIVYVQGNVDIAAGSNGVFNGLLYVDGDLTINAPCELNGAVVVTGRFTASGTADFATVNLDDGVLQALRVEVGNYRLAGAIRPTQALHEGF